MRRPTLLTAALLLSALAIPACDREEKPDAAKAPSLAGPGYGALLCLPVREWSALRLVGQLV